MLLGELDERAADTGAALISGAATSIPNSLASSATSWSWTLPTMSPSRVATAICSAPISSATSDAVVRVAPSRQSPLSAIAYTSLMRLAS